MSKKQSSVKCFLSQHALERKITVVVGNTWVEYSERIGGITKTHTCTRSECRVEDYHLIIWWRHFTSECTRIWEKGHNLSQDRREVPLSSLSGACLKMSPSLDVWTNIGPSFLPTSEDLVSVWGQDIVSKRTAPLKDIYKHFPGDQLT